MLCKEKRCKLESKNVGKKNIKHLLRVFDGSESKTGRNKITFFPQNKICNFCPLKKIKIRNFCPPEKNRHAKKRLKKNVKKKRSKKLIFSVTLCIRKVNEID